MTRLLGLPPLLVPMILAAASPWCPAQACMGYTASAQTSPVRDSMLVTAAWLTERRNDAKLVILQADRDRSGYDAGHLPGARFVALADYTETRAGVPVELPPVDRLVRLLESLGVSTDSRVVIYGNLQAATRLWFTLDYLGHGDRSALLDGGIGAWLDQGLPLSREVSVAAPGRFVPRVDPERVVDAAWVKARIGDAAVTLVDNRSRAEYRGEETETDLPRTGRIPGARHVDWTEVVLDGRLKSPTSLRRVFDDAGIAGPAEVVAYCRSGTRSAVFYFAARYLGFRTRLYDGSLSEWAARPELPLEKGGPPEP